MEEGARIIAVVVVIGVVVACGISALRYQRKEWQKSRSRRCLFQGKLKWITPILVLFIASVLGVLVWIVSNPPPATAPVPPKPKIAFYVNDYARRL